VQAAENSGVVGRKLLRAVVATKMKPVLLLRLDF
jgi:hypothetical protein